jgi:Fe-S-cluster containining protein
MSESTRRKVLELYAEADREVAAAGPVCVASGRCCRFKEYGHVLYLSSLEAEVLLASAPAYEAPVTAEFCPFQKDNLCTAREPRPLGCRVYYCDPTYQETCNGIMEKYTKRLKELCEEERLQWCYAPLHHFLNHPEDATPRAAATGATTTHGD